MSLTLTSWWADHSPTSLETEFQERVEALDLEYLGIYEAAQEAKS